MALWYTDEVRDTVSAGRSGECC